MSQIGANIRKIRLVKKMSQAEFASLFDLARPSIGAYEEGRAEPKIDTIIKIASYFKLSVDLLITKELTVDDLMKLTNIKHKLDAAHLLGGKKLGELKKDLQPVKFVPIEKHLDYVVSYHKRDFMDSLRPLQIPFSLENNCIAFGVNGNELVSEQNGVHHGDILIGAPRTVDELAPGGLYIFITDQSVIIRWLEQIAPGEVTLSRSTPDYQPMTLKIENIRQCFKAITRLTMHIHPNRPIENKVLQLEKAIEKINKKLKG